MVNHPKGVDEKEEEEDGTEFALSFAEDANPKGLTSLFFGTATAGIIWFLHSVLLLLAKCGSG